MMNKSMICIVILCLLLLGSCSSPANISKELSQTDKPQTAAIDAQMADLNAQIASLKGDVAARDGVISDLNGKLSASRDELSSCRDQINSLKDKLAGMEGVSVTYISYYQKRRFVSDPVSLLWMPTSGSPAVTTTLKNTVVEVLFAGGTGNENSNDTWLYVICPVYDSPMDNRGWMKESDSQPYTAETRKLVQGDVFVKAGTEIMADDGTGAPGKQTKLENDIRGYIEARDKDSVKISAAGGLTFWVDLKDVTYPSLT